MTLKNIFIKLSLLTITLTLVIQNTLACEELFTGTIVMDKYRNGEVKPLKTIEHIQSTYGDSAPLYNILMSKEAVALKKWDIKKISLKISVKSGNLELQKETYKDLNLWSEDASYYSFSSFDQDKFTASVNKHLENHKSKSAATNIELLLMVDQKEICKQKLSIDSH